MTEPAKPCYREANGVYPPIWPDPCGCTPGNEATGWHEQRCRMCRQVESDQWAKAMSRLPKILRDLRSER